MAPRQRVWAAQSGGRDWCAAVVLTAALATVFVFSAYDRGQFYRNATHDGVTYNHMAVAMNLSPENSFVQFYYRFVGGDGEPVFQSYHRFPPLGYALIKLTTLPFPNDLSARIRAARMLMLAFFCGAAVLAYLALRRLTGRRAVALAATLLAFSSYPLLYYGDMVATEGVVDLFAVLLAFHGIAVYSATARVGQMCAKSCAALLLGWHVYGLLLPLLLAAVPIALWARDWRALRHWVLLGALTMLVGIAMLAFNLAREYHSYGGARPFLELPSLVSAGFRTGLIPRDGHLSDSDFSAWNRLAQGELGRIGIAALPWVLAKPLHEPLLGSWHWVGVACLGLACFGVCLPGTRHRLAWSALALSGLGWAVPMRHSVIYNEHEWLFHVGAPLAAGALLLDSVRRFGAARAGRADSLTAAAIAAAALALFVASNWLMGRVGDDAETRRRERALLADAQAIHHRLGGTGGTVRTARYSLAANPQVKRHFVPGIVRASASAPHDFVIASDLPRVAPRRPPLANSPASRSLTPGNRMIFLYDADAYAAALTALQGVYEDHARADDRPAIRGVGLRVHKLGNVALLYVREGERCPAGRRASAQFFLHVYPADASDLPGAAPRPMGRFFFAQPARTPFAKLDSAESRPHWTRNGRCYSLRFLPTFPIIGLHTGELDARTGRPVWEGYISLRDVAGEHRRIAAGEPAARSTWDVYVLDGAPDGQGGTQLAYLQAPCTLAEARTRKFFLHVVPADPEHLPQSRRPAGFHNFDFHFLERGGAVDDGKCLVRIPLPDYRIATVYTGQFDEAGPLWAAEFPVSSSSRPPPPQQSASRPPPPQQSASRPPPPQQSASRPPPPQRPRVPAK